MPEGKCKSVFIGNIPFEVDEDKLREIFEQAGPISSIRILKDKDTGKPRGFGFCEYDDFSSAQTAMRNLNDHNIDGRQLRVDFADSEVGGGGSKPMSKAVAKPTSVGAMGPINATQASDSVKATLKKMHPSQLHEILTVMKIFADEDTERARACLIEYPQLMVALLAAEAQLTCTVSTPNPIVIKKAVAAPKVKMTKEERLKELGLEHLVNAEPPEKQAAKAAAKAMSKEERLKMLGLEHLISSDADPVPEPPAKVAKTSASNGPSRKRRGGRGGPPSTTSGIIAAAHVGATHLTGGAPHLTPVSTGTGQKGGSSAMSGLMGNPAAAEVIRQLKSNPGRVQELLKGRPEAVHIFEMLKSQGIL